MNLHVARTGNGPDLVLLHGWAMHAGIFAPLTELLAPRFRLHLVDLPGHGYSGTDANAADTSRWAARIAAAVPRDAIWLGWSLGGLVALQAALDPNTHARGLVLIAASPRFVVAPDWPHGVALEVFEQFGAGLHQRYRETIERFLALETLGSAHAQSELRDLKTRVFAHGEPHIAALEAGLALLEAVDLRARLRELTMPHLWIAGRRDRLVPPAAMRWASVQSGKGEFVEMASGHAPFISHADEVAQAIDCFAQGIADA